MTVRTVAQERASIHQEVDRFYEGYDELSDLLDDLLRAHAHELAETIRNSERLRDYTDDHMRDCNEAADEIDPEVSA